MKINENLMKIFLRGKQNWTQNNAMSPTTLPNSSPKALSQLSHNSPTALPQAPFPLPSRPLPSRPERSSRAKRASEAIHSCPTALPFQNALICFNKLQRAWCIQWCAQALTKDSIEAFQHAWQLLLHIALPVRVLRQFLFCSETL